MKGICSRCGEVNEEVWRSVHEPYELVCWGCITPLDTMSDFEIEQVMAGAERPN